MIRFCDKIIQYSFYLLITLIPLILTPWNYELFEFNKMILTYLLTVIIVGAWLMKMVAAKKIIFRRTPLDIGVLLFLFSQIASTILSIDRHTSFFGYYSRFNGGLLSIIAYILLYYAFVSNMNIKNTLYTLRFTLYAATLVAIYGILEHFGIDEKYWVQDVKNRVFSTLGQPNWLSAYLVGLAPLTWSFALLNEKRKAKSEKLKCFLFYILHFTFYICLLYTKSRSGFLGFGVAYLVFWSLNFISSKIRHSPFAIRQFFLFTFSILLLSFLVGTPWTPNLGQIFQKPQKTSLSPPPTQVEALPADLITPSGEIRKVVWQGAIEIFRHHPFFGTGPETFAQSYYWYRPREHNDTSEWDFLYNKAHNEYLNNLATMGAVGLGSYLLIIASFIFWNVKKLKTKTFVPSSGQGNEKRAPSRRAMAACEKTTTKNSKLLALNCIFRRNPEKQAFTLCALRFALLAGYAGLLVCHFFGFSVVITNLFLFLFPAMAFVLTIKPRGVNSVTPPGCKPTYALGIGQWLATIIILLFTVYCLLFTLRLWYADFLFAKGTKHLKADSLVQAYTYFQKAVNLNPSEPLFHNELSDATGLLALNLDLGDEATTTAQMVQLAIQESDEALKISPYHLNYLKTRTKMFYNLATIDEKYYQDALKTLLRAAELAPTDPKITYNLGLLYYYLGQKNEAIITMEKTIELKPNYDTARQKLEEWKEK